MATCQYSCIKRCTVSVACSKLSCFSTKQSACICHVTENMRSGCRQRKLADYNDLSWIHGLFLFNFFSPQDLARKISLLTKIWIIFIHTYVYTVIILFKRVFARRWVLKQFVVIISTDFSEPWQTFKLHNLYRMAFSKTYINSWTCVSKVFYAFVPYF